ncbi:trypsin-1-like [Nasonia vitripennis]|uniref:Peptidase S1 domain-containing protein n=1 Tax=Nasonia vitripennis TaxID=7425 RepID=A0A7M7GBY3_NASVI|nr:trypsin-1-like [Nasonia vitripennis]
MNCVDRYLLCLAISCSFLFYNAQLLESAPLIGGEKASSSAEEIRYLVSLQTRDTEHFCGGSIIGDRFILTAAHCVVDGGNEFEDKPIRIVAGTNDLRDEDREPLVIDVEKIYVPGNYNDSEWATSIPSSDIAVLKLNQSLNLRYNPRLKKLRLPRLNRRHKGNYRSYEGEDCVIAGFGWNKVKVKTHRKNKTEYEVGSSTDRLFRASAKVIGNAECQDYYVNPIGDSELCARVDEHNDDTPQGVCRGDSGGPLVYKSNTIIGVVSGISIGCNENNEPGIYCRVSAYIEFIKNAMKDVTDGMRVKTFED